MKKVMCLCLALSVLFGLCGCGRSSERDVLIVGTTYDIEEAVRGNYNFDMLSSGTSQPPVVAQDTDGEFEGLLADWVTEDSKTWVFTIKDGMKWSDGTDLTADCILAAINDEENFKDILEDCSVSKDGKELTLVLKDANVRFLSNMVYVRPVPQHDAQDGSQLWCGPYVLDEFNKEAGTISFAVNRYFPQKPDVDNIIFQLFSSDDTMYLALQNKDIDMVWNYSSGIPVNYQSVLKDNSGIDLISCLASNVPAVLAFNNSKGPFADKDLRMAVSYALDYESIRNYLGSSFSQIPNRGFVPSPTIGYKDTAPLKQDIKTAEEYIKSAGYTSKNGEGFFVDPQGNAAEFTLTYNSGKETHISAAELVKKQLESFGIKVNLDPLDPTAYNAKTSNKFSENNITMEAAIFSYTAAGMSMGNGLGSIYVDGNHAVQGGCQVFSEKLSSIEADMASSKTMEEYKDSAADLQDFYEDECPFLALYWDNFVYGVSSDITNCRTDANFGLNNIRNWFN